MNKKLLVLLPIAMLALAGCNNPAEGGGQGGGGQGGGGEGGGGVAPEADIVIDHDTLADHLEDKYSYPQNDYEFLAGGVKFEATSGVGHKTANTSGGNYYNEHKALQFRKEGHAKGPGVITVANAITVTTVEINWLATYASEASQYHPVVRVGDSHDAISTNVACNEGATVNGTATGGKEKGGDNNDYDVYSYKTTYTVSGHSFFHISAPAGAMYVTSIVIKK